MDRRDVKPYYTVQFKGHAETVYHRDVDLMQFTGVRFKGVEVYEGDLCDFQSYNELGRRWFEVFWNEESLVWMCRWGGDDTCFLADFDETDDASVFGNIYEQPDYVCDHA